MLWLNRARRAENPGSNPGDRTTKSGLEIGLFFIVGTIETVREIDPLIEFFSAIRNQNTKRNYEKDLARFFDFLTLTGFCSHNNRGPSQRKQNPITSGQRSKSALTAKCVTEEGLVGEN